MVELQGIIVRTFLVQKNEYHRHQIMLGLKLLKLGGGSLLFSFICSQISLMEHINQLIYKI